MTTNIFDLYKGLKNISGSTNEKVELIKNSKSPLLERVLSLTYDPIYSYYIKSVKPTDITIENESSDPICDDAVSEFLDFLIEINEGIIPRGTVAKTMAVNKIGELSPNRESSELLINILNRDLKVGINIKTINKALGKELIYIPPYMRCSTMEDSNYSKLDWKSGIIVQEKADGMFCNIIKENGKITVRTRQGTILSPDAMREITDSVEKAGMPDNRTICGELLVTKKGKVLDRKTGNGYLNSIIQNGFKPDDEFNLKLFIWDIFSKDEKRPYIERLDFIKDLFENNEIVEIIPSTIVYSKQEAFEIMKKNIENGKEGVVIKTPGALFKNGTSKDQIKLKVCFDCELEIVSLVEGSGRNADTFGSITCKSSDGKLVVNVPGFTDKMRKEIFENFESSYKGKIITVSSNEVITSKSNETASLFLPRFTELRLDKTEADSLDKIIEIFNSVYKE